MTELERQVWAAVFAAEFRYHRSAIRERMRGPEDVNGFSCADIADAAVEKMREALTSDCREYLLPVIEKWEGV